MKPIDMILYCPNCGQQHIDAPESDAAYAVHLSHGGFDNQWTNPPHKSHLCHGCGCIWRPADVATNGVAELKTSGKDDTWPTAHNEEVTAMPARGVAVPGAPSKGIYVECRECADCGHAGINDSHPTDAACNSCDWRGPSPKEDRCPNCGRDGTMTDACPKCGCGRYTLIADATVDVAGTITLASGEVLREGEDYERAAGVEGRKP